MSVRRGVVLCAAAMVMLACRRAPQPFPSKSAPSASASAAAQAASAASAARGADLYARMCAVCHGARGEGYRADGAPALAQPDFLASVSDEFLQFAIAVGRTGTPMSAWRRDQGGPLSGADIQDVIAFIRTWQRLSPVAPAKSMTIYGDEARGQALFEQQCEKCHAPKGAVVRIRNRQWLAYAMPPFIRHAIAKGRPPTPMVGFADTLGEQGIEDLVTYLKSLPSWPVPGEVEGSVKPPPIPLGPVPLHPRGPEPVGFVNFPDLTPVRTVWAQHARKARLAFLDARTPSDYRRQHIAGAVSIPFYDPTPYLDALPKDAWLVCYCSCPYAEAAGLAKQLQQAKFPKVTVLTEGLPGWVAAHHPTHEGELP